jgi:cellulose synthase (UDP-forming)
MKASKPPEKPDIPDSMYPDVDVLIATHSEDTNLLYKTLNGCLFMKYPDKNKMHIYLCDDSNRHEMKELAEQMGIGYLGLSDNKHAKAGNLNNALAKTSSPLVMTLDADMIPTSDFLLETVPYFSLPKMIKDNGVWRLRTEAELKKKEKVGFVQTPQSFYNADLFQYNLYAEENVPNEQDYFFREVNVGRNCSNSVIYAGSNTVISREALQEVGGIRTGTITEDFATGIDIQSAGYTTYAVDTVVAHGLAPKDFRSLIKQRQRWARGCVQVLRSPKFLLGSLDFRTKVSYMTSLLYWWTFLRRFIYILSPILFAVFGIVIVDCSLLELLLIWLPSYLIFNQGLKMLSGNIRNMRWSIIADTILFPYLIIPVIAETFGIRMKKFSVTPKTKTSSRNSQFKYAIPHSLLAAFSLVGIVYFISSLIISGNFGGIIVFYWLCVNMYTLLFSIICVSGRINYRNDDRIYANVPVTLNVGLFVINGETTDLSENGMAISLANPEYLPYEESLSVELNFKNYHAQVMAKVVHVRQSGDRWQYSLTITDCCEKNRKNYLQIVFDREHTLPKTIKSDLLKDISSVFKGRLSKQVLSNRKLPRVPMNVCLPTTRGYQVELLSYNYEYIIVKNVLGLQNKLTILFGNGIYLRCEQIADQQINGGKLFRIQNWKRLSLNPFFRENLFALINAEDLENSRSYQLTS